MKTNTPDIFAFPLIVLGREIFCIFALLIVIISSSFAWSQEDAHSATTFATTNPLTTVALLHLQNAKANYNQALTIARHKILLEIDDALTFAMNHGNIDDAGAIKKEQSAFEKSEGFALPSPPELAHIKQDWQSTKQHATAALSLAYDRAVADALRLHDLDSALEIKRQHDAFIRASHSDSLPAGLLRYFSFQTANIFTTDGLSILQDRSTNQRDALLCGAVISAEEREHPAAEFDGRSWVDCRTIDLTNEAEGLTLAVFVKIDQDSDGQLISKDDWENNGTRGFVLRLYSGRPDFSLAVNGWQSVQSKTALSTNQWHHLAGTYDGLQMRLFVDGVEEARKPLTGSISPSPYPLFLGRCAFDSTRSFKGKLSECMLFSRGLSSDEIKQIATRY